MSSTNSLNLDQSKLLSFGKELNSFYLQELNRELFSPEVRKDTDVTEESLVNRDDLLPDSLKGSATAVWNTIKDLHLELIHMYHRVCLKLEQMGPDANLNLPKPFKRRTCSRMQFVSLFYKAVFGMHRL